MNTWAWRYHLRTSLFSTHAQKFLDAVAALEKLGWITFMLAVPEYNKRMLKGKVNKVKVILAKFSFPYSRRIGGEHTHFTRGTIKNGLRKHP